MWIENLLFLIFPQFYLYFTADNLTFVKFNTPKSLSNKIIVLREEKLFFVVMWIVVWNYVISGYSLTIRRLWPMSFENWMNRSETFYGPLSVNNIITNHETAKNKDSLWSKFAVERRECCCPFKRDSEILDIFRCFRIFRHKIDPSIIIVMSCSWCQWGLFLFQ